MAWCSGSGAIVKISGVGRIGQTVTADSLTIASSLKDAMVSSVM